MTTQSSRPKIPSGLESLSASLLRELIARNAATPGNLLRLENIMQAQHRLDQLARVDAGALTVFADSEPVLRDQVSRGLAELGL